MNNPHDPLLEGKKIFLVEDDPFLGSILYGRITAHKATVTLIKSGDEVLPALKKDLPDLMLLDIQLPVLDGFQILESVRADEQMKVLPVIIISNFNQVSDRERAAKLGAPFLVKALVNPDDIVREVSTTLIGKI